MIINTKQFFPCAVVLLTACAASFGERTIAQLKDLLASVDPTIVKGAVEELRQLSVGDPRAFAGDAFRERLPDSLLENKLDEEAAEISLICANAQLDRTDRLEYFLERRTRALIAAGRYQDALASAKSLYCVCSVAYSPRAVDLLAECLRAHHDDDPSLARRFKLQQLLRQPGPGNPTSQPSPTLGEPVLSTLTVDASLYNDENLSAQRSREWRQFGRANLMLLQNRPADARQLLEPMTRSATRGVAEAATDGLARVVKAEQGSITAANAFLLEHGQANPSAP